MATSRGLKALIGIIAGIVALVLVVLAALPALVNVNQYHDRIQAELQKALNRPVTLGSMQLKTFPVRIRVNDVNIGEDPAFSTGSPFATAQQLDVSVKLLPLLSKDIQVNSVELISPKVQLVRNAQGQWNYSTLGGESKSTKTSSSSNQQLSVNKLKLTDGSVTIVDSFHTAGASPSPATMRSTYDHINLELDDYAPGKPFDINLSANLPGQGNQSLALKGRIGPINQTNSAATPMDAKLTLNSVQIAALQQFLHSQALEDTFGVATGNISLKNDSGNFAANGNLKLDNGKLHGVDLGYPLSADFDAKGDLTSQQFDISKLDVKLGPTPVSVNGQINAKAVPAIADLHVKASDASLAEISRLASAFGVAVAADAKVTGKLNADVSAKGALDAPALNGTLQLANVEMTGAQIKQPVNIPNLRLALTPTQLRSDPFVVNSGDMHLNVTFAMSNYASSGKAVAQPQVQFTLAADKLDVEQMQAMFSAAPSNNQKQRAKHAS
ncbi:MAG: AsmA family protein, partial [Acidobacteriales bacterium]|nr:AsmA family protein [Terriglobales bacterium]